MRLGGIHHGSTFVNAARVSVSMHFFGHHAFLFGMHCRKKHITVNWQKSDRPVTQTNA